MKRWRILRRGKLNGYKIDRRLMLLMYLPIFALGAGALVWSFINGFQGIECEERLGCLNPYYGLCDDVNLCGFETIPYGYAYNVPPKIFTDYAIFPMLLLGVGYFLINHYKNNRGFDFELQ